MDFFKDTDLRLAAHKKCHITIDLFTTLIGCTILRAVSGILRTHRGRRGIGPGRLPVGVTVAGRSGPERWRSGPAGSDAAPFALGLCGLPTGLCGFTRCP